MRITLPFTSGCKVNAELLMEFPASKVAFSWRHGALKIEEKLKLSLFHNVLYNAVLFSSVWVPAPLYILKLLNFLGVSCTGFRNYGHSTTAAFCKGN